MNTTELERFRFAVNELKTWLDQLPPVDTSAATSGPMLLSGTTTLELLSWDVSSEGEVFNLLEYPDQYIREYAEDVGERHAKVEYLYALALAQAGYALEQTLNVRRELLPLESRDDKGELGLVETLAGAWTDALNTWKAYEAERESVYGREESAA